MTPADSMHLMERIAEVYAWRLHESPGANACLQALNVADPQLLEDFKAGYSDGHLAAMLPRTGEVAEVLRTKGLLTPDGEETLCGCLVLPVLDAERAIIGFYGLRPRTGSAVQEIVVPGNLGGVVRGTLARDGSAGFVTTAVWDAFSLWAAGFHNVVTAVDNPGSAPALKQIVLENRYMQLWFCGSKEGPASKLLPDLRRQLADSPTPIKLSIVSWPSGITGPRQFFQNHTPQDFEGLLSQDPVALPLETKALTSAAPGSCFTETADGMEACFDGRRYEVRAIRKPGPGRLRATLRAVGDAGRFVVETVNFYYLRSRRGFVAEAARLFHQPVDSVEQDLGRITDELENYMQRRAAPTTPVAVSVEPADRSEGLKLGRAPDLVDQIVRDMGALGVIGEATNKLLSYLVMTSRKMPEPLALLILSGSGAGKSLLQDSALALCPEEDLVKVTSLTDQALFYRGENSLRHKVLALEEHLGAKGAAYPLRNLISARKLVIETTAKNTVSGKLETQVNTVYGPTAVFQTTTDPNTDPETRSRFIVISVDESPEQTRAILERQRHLHTLEALHLRRQRESVMHRHHTFQRLLRQIPIVNAYEPLLSYPDRHLMVRRDQPKYLQLILAVTFLHQMQRPVRRDPELGDYLETTLDDIALANDLAHRVLGNSLADLSAPARELLFLAQEHLRKNQPEQEQATFTRRELREAIHWGDTRLRIHLRELVDLEFAAALQGRFGFTYRYCLLDKPNPAQGDCLPGLKPIEQLRVEAGLAGLAPTSHLRKREVAPALTGSVPASSHTAPGTSRISGENNYLQSWETLDP